jgi:hypothetical protein
VLCIRNSVCQVSLFFILFYFCVSVPLGEQVLRNFSYSGVPLSTSIMGQLLTLAGMLLLGVLVLHYNQLRYLSLGHVGSLQRRQEGVALDAEDNTTVARADATAASGGGGAAAAGGGKNRTEEVETAVVSAPVPVPVGGGQGMLQRGGAGEVSMKFNHIYESVGSSEKEVVYFDADPRQEKAV